jgi:serine/threonine-protein kinase
MCKCESPFLPKFGPLRLRQITLDSGETILYFLEEYIDGLPLASVHSPLAPLQVVWLCRCIGDALRVLDSHGYVHRDVKPMNIIQKTSSTYVLIDAGLAVDPDGEQLSSANERWGTTPFFSPEQITLPSRDLDVRSDLFSLGVTLYQYATGEHPFINEEMPGPDIFGKITTLDPPDPRRFAPELPETLCSLIMTMLEKDRDKRFATPHDMLTELARVELALS